MDDARPGAAKALLSFVFVFLLLGAGCRREEPLPELAHVPDFTLIDQDGRSFGASNLEGRPVVAAFLFTRCTSICPMLASQMVNFRRRLGPRASRVRFVAFSVDPTHDTPEVLRTYAARQGASDGFTFLTGDTDVVVRVARQGFLAAVGEPVTGPDGLDVIHSQHLLLLDARRTMRGYYRTDAEGLAALDRDIDRLLDEGAR